MFNWFSKNVIEEKQEINLIVITLDEIHTHFNILEHNSDQDFTGFKPDETFLDSLKDKIKPDRKNIFILDDVCDLVDILDEELTNELKNKKILDKFNIITMCTLSVGFDMLSVLALTDIKVDFLLTDITFGGNRIINGEHIVLDGIDTLILIKEKFPDCQFLIFTGNILTESNIKHYNFSKKFNYYMNESILKYIIHKDTALNFDQESNILIERLTKLLS